MVRTLERDKREEQTEECVIYGPVKANSSQVVTASTLQHLREVSLLLHISSPFSKMDKMQVSFSKHLATSTAPLHPHQSPCADQMYLL